MSTEGDPEAVDLVWPMRRRGSLEFSFSGLKTDVKRWVMKNGRPGDDRTLRDLCAAFQRRVVDTLVAKLVAAAEREGVSSIVIAGGVAANRELLSMVLIDDRGKSTPLVDNFGRVGMLAKPEFILLPDLERPTDITKSERIFD